MTHLFHRCCCAVPVLSCLTKQSLAAECRLCIHMVAERKLMSLPNCSTPWSLSSDAGAVPPQLALAFPLQPLSISSSVHCPLYKAKPVFFPSIKTDVQSHISHLCLSSVTLNPTTFTKQTWEPKQLKVQNIPLKVCHLSDVLPHRPNSRETLTHSFWKFMKSQEIS